MADKEDPVFRKREPSEFGPDWERINKVENMNVGMGYVGYDPDKYSPTVTVTSADGQKECPIDMNKFLTSPDDWKASPPPNTNGLEQAIKDIWGMTDERRGKMTEGTKKDDDKDPWDLLAWDAVREVVKVLAFGVRKYERRNWEKGIKYSRCYSAAIRHLTAWWDGEETDNESGLNHLAHAMCCVLFLLAYRVRGMDQFDDRPHKGEIK